MKDQIIKLEINKKCDVCKKENQFFCHSCGHVTREQIHANCLLEGVECDLSKEIPVTLPKSTQVTVN